MHLSNWLIVYKTQQTRWFDEFRRKGGGAVASRKTEWKQTHRRRLKHIYSSSLEALHIPVILLEDHKSSAPPTSHRSLSKSNSSDCFQLGLMMMMMMMMMMMISHGATTAVTGWKADSRWVAVSVWVSWCVLYCVCASDSLGCTSCPPWCRATPGPEPRTPASCAETPDTEAETWDWVFVLAGTRRSWIINGRPLLRLELCSDHSPGRAAQYYPLNTWLHIWNLSAVLRNQCLLKHLVGHGLSDSEPGLLNWNSLYSDIQTLSGWTCSLTGLIPSKLAACFK